MQEPENKIAVAVIRLAVLDAHSGRYQVRSQNWLLSRDSENWLDLLNIDPGRIHRWVHEGCKLKSGHSFQFLFKG